MFEGENEVVEVYATDKTTANIFACEYMIGQRRLYRGIVETALTGELKRGVIGAGREVHRVIVWGNGDVSSPLCGSGQHMRKFCTTSRTRLVDAPLTCSKCIKAEAEAVTKSG